MPTSGGTVYNGAISLTSTTTIQAIAVKADMNDSAVAAVTFTRRSSSGGGGGGGFSAPSYSVSVDVVRRGGPRVPPTSAQRGPCDHHGSPNKGYILESLTVLDKDGKALELTDKGGGKYTFTMPAGKVTVKAVFMDDNTMLNFFTDVHAEDYYYDAVLWAAQKGITGGMSDTLFAPNLSCTRAQIVTFLWRAAGSPEPKALSSSRMFRQMRTTPRQLRGRLRMALPRARAIQRLHSALSAREHKAQRSCTVRQAVRRSAAARPSPMYLPMHTTPMRQHGQSRRASPTASETVCSVRITTAPSTDRHVPVQTVRQQISKSIDGKRRQGNTLAAVCLPILCAISRFGASCILGQTAAIRAGKLGKMSYFR